VTAVIERIPAAPDPSPTPLFRRIYGLGSVYAATMRIARTRFLLLTAVMAGVMLTVGAAIPKAYPTQAARDQMARLATDLGAAAAGLAGKPVNVGTLGGYLQWKYGALFLWIVAIWAILSLSATLAGEARTGALDLVVSAPLSRRRVAVEKIAAHLTFMTVSLLLVALAAWLTATAAGTLPGDAISPWAALGYALWVALMAFAFGGLALLLSQFLGRSAGAGIAGALLFAGWILNGYRTTVPAFRGPADLTPWAWTANHLPLAGQNDWPSLVPVALLAALLLTAGVEAFVRRDLGDVRTARLPQPPAMVLGLRGPASRSFGERWPRGLVWALGLASFGLVMAAASPTFADQVAQSPDIAKTFRSLFPGIDMTTAGGFLQLVFVQLGFVIVGFAAVSLVSGWASDETSGRLEMLLSTPLSRRSWVLESALGLGGVLVAMTVVLAAGVGIGSAAGGSSVTDPIVGSLSLGLYAAAVTGVGLAVGGFRAAAAAPTLAALVSATFLVDLLAPGLNLPGWVHGLALTTHLGQPMLGHGNPVGELACLTVAIAGTAIGAWGLHRRDV
jgi:ABC-2 type transport system permease protein